MSGFTRSTTSYFSGKTMHTVKSADLLIFSETFTYWYSYIWFGKTFHALRFHPYLPNPVNKLHDWALQITFQVVNLRELTNNACGILPSAFLLDDVSWVWLVRAVPSVVLCCRDISGICSVAAALKRAECGCLTASGATVSLSSEVQPEISRLFTLSFNFWRARGTVCLNVAKVSEYCFSASRRVWVFLLI